MKGGNLLKVLLAFLTKLRTIIIMRVYALTALPALASGFMIVDTNTFRRPIVLQATERDDYSPRGGGGGDPEEEFRRWRDQQQQFSRVDCGTGQSADEAFDNLINEMNSAASSPRNIQKQKDWVKSAFGMASEFNRGVADSEEEAQRNEEMLRKQQKWADKIIDFTTELTQDFSPPASRSTAGETAGGTKNMQGQSGTSEQEAGEFTMTPSYTINDDDDAFQVAIELPGVKLADIDIDVDMELQILTISGERQMIGSDARTKFSKTFGLEPTVRVDDISASLSSGILLVSAPKEVKRAKGRTMKIPVTAEG